MNKLAEFLPDFMHFDALSSANLIFLIGIILLLGALGGRLFQKLKIEISFNITFETLV